MSDMWFLGACVGLLVLLVGFGSGSGEMRCCLRCCLFVVDVSGGCFGGKEGRGRKGERGEGGLWNCLIFFWGFSGFWLAGWLIGWLLEGGCCWWEMWM